MLTQLGLTGTNPDTSCCGAKEIYTECLRDPGRVFEYYRGSYVDKNHASSFRDENMHCKTKWRVEKGYVTWQFSGVHSRIFLQHLACVFSLCLLLCTKTSKERNHNTGDLNVSATFLLESNYFQRNDTGISVLVFFVLTSKRLVLENANLLLLPFVTAPICSAVFILSHFVYFHSLSPKEAGIGVGRNRSVPPSIPTVSRNISVLGLLLCWESCTYCLQGKATTWSVCEGLLLGCLYHG